MKSIRLIALAVVLLAGGMAATAQTSNAILFTENGEKFTAILNGLRQNEKPETNVKIQGLNANFYKLKIIFENEALGQNNFNLGIEPGTETTYVIKQNKKNEYVLRPMSMVPIAEAPPTPASTQVVTFNPSAPAYTGEEVVTQQVTTTTTTSGTPPAGGGVSMGISVGDAGGSFNMNVSGFDNMGGTSTQQTTITTTTTTTSSGSNPVYSAPPPSTPPPAYLPGYNGAVGCAVPVAQGEFQSMKRSISTKTFEESKLTLAKQVINNNCLFSDQVLEIMQLFTFEDSKLDFAKYAYSRTYDIGNYYKVNDAFTFESSIDELNAFINSRR
jgi:hypothetical protein